MSGLLESRRRRATLGYTLLALLAYVPPLLTKPGKVGADTKQYLYLDPGRLLSRSVSMWDPHVGMGTVTHQTIGYAFPMGPYYWILEKLGSPAWVSQRLWLGSLLFAAALGVLFLLRTFGLRGPGVVVAALAFMCTPYVLDYAARISVLLMPWAALPWMIAVIRKALREKGWRYPAIFALIVQVIGGVNATALIYAGVGPVLWILYAWLVAREVDARRALGVALKTGGLTLLTSLWWIAGLRMQGTYGLDVLKYSETVETVALTSTPNEVLRGLGYWFFYGQDRLGPWIEAARDYTQHSWVIFAGYSLVVLSLLSAAFLRWRHRVFFVLLLLVGVVISVGAHPYASPTPLGGLFKKFATSSTAGLALRSTGRAAPLVVLALAVFLGLAVNTVFGRLRGRGQTALAYAVPVLVGILIFVNFPALVDGTFYAKNLERDQTLPSYWTQAIAALNAGDHQTRILEEPGADFASYTWGNTVDPITPGLTDRPYVARELIPYGTPGTADLLNAIDRRLQVGVADPAGLGALWRRMGVGDVVARNDIQYERYDLVRPEDLAAVLNAAPGLGSPTGYGPPSDFTLPAGFADEISLSTPATAAKVAPVEVYPVQHPTSIVRAESTDHALMVSGDGEGLVDAADVGLLDGAGVIRYSGSYTSADALRRATGAADVLVVTDSNRLRARRWTTVTQTVGFTEQAGATDAPLDTDPTDARLDVFPGEQPSALTTTDQVGVRRVVATAFGNTNTYWPEDRPAMALDGDPGTAWETQGFGDARGQRIEVDLKGPITTDHVNLVQPLTGNPNRFITNAVLTFDGGKPVNVVLGARSRTAAGQTVTFPSRTFRTFTVTIKQTNDHRTNLFGQDDPVGFAEIRLRDVHATRDVRVDEVVQMPSDELSALGASSGDHPLVLVMNRDAIRPVPPRTQPELSIAREFVVPSARTFVLTGNATVSPDAPDAAITAALHPVGGAREPIAERERASLPGCLACRADAAFDDDPASAWQTPFDQPTGQWAQAASPSALALDHLDLSVIADGRHSVPTRVRVTVDGHSHDVAVPSIADGTAENAVKTVHLTFPTLRGHAVRVTVLAVRAEQTALYGTGRTRGRAGRDRELRHRRPLGVDSRRRKDRQRVSVRSRDRRRHARAGPHHRRRERRLHHIGIDRQRVRCSAAARPGAARAPHRSGQDQGLLDRPCRARLGNDDDGGQRCGRRARALDRGRRDEGCPAVGTCGQGDPQRRHEDACARRRRHETILARTRRIAEPGVARAGGRRWRPRRVATRRRLRQRMARDAAAIRWFRRRLRMDAATPSEGRDLVVVARGRALLRDHRVHLDTCRRAVVATAATARPGDADITLDRDFQWSVGAGVVPARGRLRWIAPLTTGLLAGLVVAPWVGALTTVVVFAVVARPRLRPVVLLVPGALLAVCGAYIVVQQHRYRYPPVFEWPTLFPHACTLAWIAVVLLAADAITEILRSRLPPGSGERLPPGSGERLPPEPFRERGPAPDPEGS